VWGSRKARGSGALVQGGEVLGLRRKKTAEPTFIGGERTTRRGGRGHTYRMWSLRRLGGEVFYLHFLLKREKDLIRKGGKRGGKAFVRGRKGSPLAKGFLRDGCGTCNSGEKRRGILYKGKQLYYFIKKKGSLGGWGEGWLIVKPVAGRAHAGNNSGIGGGSTFGVFKGERERGGRGGLPRFT